MKCYRCNSTLSENNFCNSCGADVAVYKKVVRLSNAYYNMGLAKAQIRDLTGACELLRRSVRFDKRNTNARNLLGLVYYEMGEAVQALSEWVISKNLQPEKNLADDYIRRLQSNPVRLDTINQTIKKYNLALGYAKQGNDDVAVIQLKKVLNSTPNMVKGHLLLALLYMKKGEFEKARKPLMKALKIDTNHPLAKKYLKALENELGIKNNADREKPVRERKVFTGDGGRPQSEKEFLSGYDVITPQKSGYKESNSGFMTVINVMIGLVVGVAMTFFLLIPAKEKSLNAEHNKEVLKLNSQIDILNNEKSDLQTSIQALEGEKENLSGQLANKGNESNEIINDYNFLLTAVTYYNSTDYINCAVSLNSIKNGERSEAFKTLFNSLKPEAYKQAASAYYENGRNAYYSAGTVENWQTVIDNLQLCFNYDFMQINYLDAIDKLGSAYEKQYELALSQSPDTAGSYKEKALLSLADLAENVFAKTENINPQATEKAQAYIHLITAK